MQTTFYLSVVLVFFVLIILIVLVLSVVVILVLVVVLVLVLIIVILVVHYGTPPWISTDLIGLIVFLTFLYILYFTF